MSVDVNLEGLFEYYKYTLSIENVLSFSILQKDLEYPNLMIFSERIREEYARSFIDKRKPVFTEREVPQYLVSAESSFAEFFNVAEDIEKTVNLRTKWALKDNKINIENHPEYQFAENNYFQYGIVVNFAKESPQSKYKPKYLPCMIVLFDNIDSNYKQITPDVVFEHIKRFLGLPYNKNIDKEELRKPITVHNPKIIEPYSIDFDKFNKIDFENKDKILSLFNTEDSEYVESGVYLCAFSQNMTQGLIRIYESMQKNEPNKLIRDYFNIYHSKKTKANTGTFNIGDMIGTKKVVDSYLNHYGAFDKEFCLSETQRIAMTCYLQGNSIVPVNGAPGTGKTSLLRAIAGDYIVKAALESCEAFLKDGVVGFKTPIVCTSTNNQALHNISEGIESGFNSSKDDGILYQRWLRVSSDRKYKNEGKNVTENLDLKERFFVPSIKSTPANFLELSKADIMHAISAAMENSEEYINSFEEFEPGMFPEDMKLHDKLVKCIIYFQTRISSNIVDISYLGEMKDSLDTVSGLEDVIAYHYYREDKSWLRDLFALVKVGDVESIELHLKTAEYEPFIEEYKDYNSIKNEIIENNKALKYRDIEQARKDSSLITRMIFFLFKKGALADRINEIEAKYIRLSHEQTHAYIYEKITGKAFELSRELVNLNEFKAGKNNLDTTLRTDNFYYAIHLLEALLLISTVKPEKNFATLTCPVCKQKIMYKVASSGNYHCKDCKVTCVISNYADFTEFEIEHILNEGNGYIKGEYYEAVQNGKYININKIDYPNKNILNGILPLFPIVNITCNSMGTILKEGDNVDKDIVDFMLIDEAGTITPSKMAVLYCAKKAMFFGDVKQLKPVYSFDKAFEEAVMKNYMDETSVKYASHYFSCADMSNSDDGPEIIADSMSIANNCCEFFLPYNKSKLEGDIWLKEHYRCSKSIIQIANEMTYENEIVPCKKDSDNIRHLEFVDHSELRDPRSNTNEGEAGRIIKYILDNNHSLMSQLGIDDENELYDSIGIVTPFRNQHFLLESMLREDGLENIKVGTVHKFQGSERRVIIFSSVYSSGDAKRFFFNRGESDMLNVTVTRAKDMFICFGHKDLLNVESTFSGIMMRHIDNY